MKHQHTSATVLALAAVATVVAGCFFDGSGLAPDTDPILCGNAALDPGEQCDADALNAATCQSLGFSGGTLACAADCTYDTGACDTAPTCGNSILDLGEACDGANLGGETCQALGLGTGPLSCTAACELNTSGCVVPPNCGDGALDTGEECDDGNSQDDDECLSNCQLATCGDGILRNSDPAESCDDGDNDVCTGGCNADCSGPGNTCGDGVVRCGETCEAGDLQGQDCTDFGFANPIGLVCTGCALDPSGCIDTCGDGVLDTGEVCDDADPNADWQLCDDFANLTPSSDYSFDIDVPTQVGTYYLRWGRSWDYGCYGTGSPTAARSLVVVCVY